jgi:tricarballylate dehydrogenase
MPGLYACGEMLGGLCAAIAAREAGADVCLLERAPEALRGGNSAFTAGLMRTVYDDLGDVLRLVDSRTGEDLARTDFGSYTAGDFLDTLARITEYRCDPELASRLVRSSTETLGVADVARRAVYGRQAFRQGDRGRFGLRMHDRPHQRALRHAQGGSSISS